MWALYQEDNLAFQIKYSYLTHSMCYHGNQLFGEWQIYSFTENMKMLPILHIKLFVVIKSKRKWWQI